MSSRSSRRIPRYIKFQAFILSIILVMLGGIAIALFSSQGTVQAAQLEPSKAFRQLKTKFRNESVRSLQSPSIKNELVRTLESNSDFSDLEFRINLPEIDRQGYVSQKDLAKLLPALHGSRKSLTIKVDPV